MTQNNPRPNNDYLGGVLNITLLSQDSPLFDAQAPINRYLPKLRDYIRNLYNNIVVGIRRDPQLMMSLVSGEFALPPVSLFYKATRNWMREDKHSFPLFIQEPRPYDFPFQPNVKVSMINLFALMQSMVNMSPEGSPMRSFFITFPYMAETVDVVTVSANLPHAANPGVHTLMDTFADLIEDAFEPLGKKSQVRSLLLSGDLSEFNPNIFNWLQDVEAAVTDAVSDHNNDVPEDESDDEDNAKQTGRRIPKKAKKAQAQGAGKRESASLPEATFRKPDVVKMFRQNVLEKIQSYPQKNIPQSYVQNLVSSLAKNL